MHEAHRISTIGSKRQRDARGRVAEEGREGLRKVPWRHLLHESLIGSKKCFIISGDTVSMADRLSHRPAVGAFQEAADDV